MHLKMDLRAVIIDDEEDARKALSSLLLSEHANVHLLGCAEGVAQGLDLIRRVAPDLVFLDVELRTSTGFELLEALGDNRPYVIFTTAHEGYAVKAIRFSALDFLLKPVDPSELATAISKVMGVAQERQTPQQFRTLLQNFGQDRAAQKRLALPTMDGLVMADVANILYCQGDGHYTTIGQLDRKPVVISRNLGQLEDLLPTADFVRIHHSHLVAIKHIVKYIRGEGGEVVMADGTNLAVSKRKKQDLMDRLAKV